MSSRPGVSAPGPKKSKTESKRVKIDCFFNYFDSFSTPFSAFGPRVSAQGSHFRTLFFPTLGPEGPNDPCSGQKFSQGPKSLQIFEMQFSGNYFRNIFYPGRVCPPKSLQTFEMQFSGNYFRNIFFPGVCPPKSLQTFEMQFSGNYFRDIFYPGYVPTCIVIPLRKHLWVGSYSLGHSKWYEHAQTRTAFQAFGCIGAQNSDSNQQEASIT